MQFWHQVGGRRYFSLQDDPRHATMDDYRECIRQAYGSLAGVITGWTADLPDDQRPLSTKSPARHDVSPDTLKCIRCGLFAFECVDAACDPGRPN